MSTALAFNRTPSPLLAHSAPVRAHSPARTNSCSSDSSIESASPSTPPQTPQSQRTLGRKMLLSLTRSASVLKMSRSNSTASSIGPSPPASLSPPRIGRPSLAIEPVVPALVVSPSDMSWPVSPLPSSERDTSLSLLSRRGSATSTTSSTSDSSLRPVPRSPLPASYTFPSPPRKMINPHKRPKTPCPFSAETGGKQGMPALRVSEYDLATFLGMDPLVVLAEADSDAVGYVQVRSSPLELAHLNEFAGENDPTSWKGSFPAPGPMAAPRGVGLRRSAAGGGKWFEDEGDEDFEMFEREKLCQGLERLLWGN